MNANLTYADILRPAGKAKAVLYDAALIIAGSLIIALFAQIAVGFPVPITGQTFAVLIIAALLGAKRAALCMIAYLAEGAMGLPVFAMGRAGVAVLSGPTGGYIAGFVPAALITGALAQKGWDRRFITAAAAMTIGNICIYAFGFFWLSSLVGPEAALNTGIYPFIPGDLIKIFLAAALLPGAWKLLRRKNQ